ncbi:MAG: hypothetical protein KDB79_02170 [Acidobacteria bacterium]|nr:hypothetical protein [Acidobacteriota bacterium]
MKFFLTHIFVLLLFGAITGQDDIQTSSGRQLPTTPEQARERDFESRLRNMNRLMNQKPERSRTKIKKLSKEERKRFEDATSPSEELIKKYKEFLRQSNTGIFRLIPNFGCQSEAVIKLDGDCAGFVPDAWAYSFRAEDYSGEELHDISYIKNRIVSNSLLNQGILVDIGNADPAAVALDEPGLLFLQNFDPAEDRVGAHAQFMELAAGIESDGFYYSNSVGLKPGNTYAYRAISYRYGDKWSSRFRGRNFQKLSKEEQRFAWINLDERNDSIYVFAVVAQDEDRGVTIVWKRLSKEKSPKLVFAKEEKLEDF